MKIERLAYHWPTKLYDIFAPLYDLWMGIFFRLGKVGHRRVAEGLSEGAILDIACGTGTLITDIVAESLSAIGIDLSAGMLQQAMRKRTGGKWIRGDFYRLPFPSGVFDYVVETNALGGVTVELDHVLREMLRVCKLGGEIRIADYMQPVRHSWKTKLIKLLFALSGDSAHDLISYIHALGYTGSIESLGLSGMYQTVRVVKTH